MPARACPTLVLVPWAGTGMETWQLSPGAPWGSSSRDCHKEGLFTGCLGGDRTYSLL